MAAVNYSFLLTMPNLNVFILNDSGMVVDVSAGVENLLGFLKGEILNRNFIELFPDSERIWVDDNLLRVDNPTIFARSKSLHRHSALFVEYHAAFNGLGQGG